MIGAGGGKNITGTITFNRFIMAYILYTSSHGNPKPSNRPGYPAITTTKQGFSVTFEVDFKSGRTVKIAKKEAGERPGLHDGAEFIVIALGGNDLSPGKIPSDDLVLAKEVAKDLWDLQQSLSRNDTRVDVCTLIRMPKYDQFHQLLIQKTNIRTKQKFGEGIKISCFGLGRLLHQQEDPGYFLLMAYIWPGYKIYKKGNNKKKTCPSRALISLWGSWTKCHWTSELKSLLQVTAWWHQARITVLHNRCNGCPCPGNARGQGICRHDLLP